MVIPFASMYNCLNQDCYWFFCIRSNPYTTAITATPTMVARTPPFSESQSIPEPMEINTTPKMKDKIFPVEISLW